MATDLSSASAAALGALQLLNENKFKRMDEIVREFRWSSFFFSGYDLYAVNTLVPMSDPRFLFSQGDLSYIEFAANAKPQDQVVFVGFDGTLESIDFTNIRSEFIQKVDLTNGTIKPIAANDLNQICKYVAAIHYLNKQESFIKQGNNAIRNATYNLFVNRYADMIRAELSLLERHTRFTREELIENNGGLFVYTASFALPDTIREYNEIRAEYDRYQQEILGILKSVSNLTLCYNQSATGDPMVIGNENEVNINVQQTINCLNDVIQQETAQHIESIEEEPIAVEKLPEEIVQSEGSVSNGLIAIIIIVVILSLLFIIGAAVWIHRNNRADQIVQSEKYD